MFQANHVRAVLVASSSKRISPLWWLRGQIESFSSTKRKRESAEAKTIKGKTICACSRSVDRSIWSKRQNIQRLAIEEAKSPKPRTIMTIIIIVQANHQPRVPIVGRYKWTSTEWMNRLLNGHQASKGHHLAFIKVHGATVDWKEEEEEDEQVTKLPDSRALCRGPHTTPS